MCLKKINVSFIFLNAQSVIKLSQKNPNKYRQIEISAAVEIKTSLCVRAFGKLISLAHKCRIKKEY